MPESGQINYQEQKINETNLFEYRNLFAATFTDSHVFQDLRYLSTRVNESEMQKKSALLGIEDKIEVDQFNISAVDLSFGQRGRLTLLRVLLEDQPIYLFDEWAANQDPYFRSKFYHEILPDLKSKGKTIIVISHDDQYYHLADRLITLSSGNITTISG
jgi:putative ATP-binding cassette transporter